MSAETRSLTAIVSRIIELQRDVPRINPSVVASAALLELDSAAVRAGCGLALKQIARGLLRKRFLERDDDEDDENCSDSEQSSNDDDAAEPEQVDLFGGLQRRYPSSKQAGEYVLLEQMSTADISFNVSRLRKEGATKSAHADALEKFGRGKQWEKRRIAS